MDATRHADASLGLLRNPLRAALLVEVRSQPGILQSQLAVRLGCARATVRHHVVALQRAGLVRVVSQRQRAATFPGGTPPERQAALAALRRGRTLELARLVAANPGLHQTDITRGLRMGRKVVRRCVGRLAAHGLVDEVAEPPFLSYYPTPELTAALAALAAPPADLVPAAAVAISLRRTALESGLGQPALALPPMPTLDRAALPAAHL